MSARYWKLITSMHLEE